MSGIGLVLSRTPVTFVCHATSSIVVSVTFMVLGCVCMMSLNLALLPAMCLKTAAAGRCTFHGQLFEDDDDFELWDNCSH